MNAPFYFEIQVEYIDRARRFYEGVFGWHFTRDEGMEPEYWHAESNGMSGGMFERPAPIPAGKYSVNAFIRSIEVDDFGSAAANIAEHGGTVTLPRFPLPGRGWLGYFLDTEGNTFGILEVDEGSE